MSRQHVTMLPASERLPRVRGAWLAFRADEDPEHARRRFVARYGVEPRELVRCGPLLLAGPLERIDTAKGEGHDRVDW
ncbi:MAG: hypothetical protein QME94_14745 [Anaerolineae bacterium]|nr:hypothetical protein [Anaerolineae bacterium]